VFSNLTENTGLIKAGMKVFKEVDSNKQKQQQLDKKTKKPAYYGEILKEIISLSSLT
jgi:hypothetical protein